ncbi:MAG: hypothetical protein ACRD10_14605 [Terriglobia bacterium]
MEFILQTQAQIQAQHATAIQKSDERMTRIEMLAGQHEERMDRTEASVATVTDLVGRLAQAEIRLVERMGGQETRLQSLESNMSKLFDRIDRFVQGLEGNGHERQ